MMVLLRMSRRCAGSVKKGLGLLYACIGVVFFPSPPLVGFAAVAVAAAAVFFYPRCLVRVSRKSLHDSTPLTFPISLCPFTRNMLQL